MNVTPSEAVLNWATGALGVGAAIVSLEGLHEGSSPWLLRVHQGGNVRDLVLRVADMGRIWPQAIATGAAALRVAEVHGLAAPRLIASDLDGKATGVAATLETTAPGSSTIPAIASPERLRQAGSALARVHRVPLAPTPDLPLRTRPTGVDDWALERRWASLYRASPDDDKPAVVAALSDLTGWSAENSRKVMENTRLSALLQLADERLRTIPMPQDETVFVHGDIWAGNMMWEGGTCVALIDWKTAGVGDPGVDLGNLRLHMAFQYGQDAPGWVLDGWQQESGREATNLAYWDAVAALQTPAFLEGWEEGFDNKGAPVSAEVVTERRDAFLRQALDRLGDNHTKVA